MCTTFFKKVKRDSGTLSASPKFIIAFNRDISFLRATKRCSYWCEDPNILGGKDKVRGGSWFLFNTKTGNIAFLTDIWTGVFMHGIKKARGDIIRKFCCSGFFGEFTNMTFDTCAEEFTKMIQEDRQSYAPFNLVLGNLRSDNSPFFYLDSISGELNELENGRFHGLSNSDIKEPFKKVDHGIEFLHNEENKITSKEEALEVMRSLMTQDHKYDAIGTIEDEGGIFVNPCFYKNDQIIRGTESMQIFVVDFDLNFVFRESFFQPDVDDIDDIRFNPSNKFYKFQRGVRKILALVRFRRAGKVKIKRTDSHFEGRIG